MLRRLGYQPEAVGDGKQAVEALAAQDFGLVLMDVQMPVMDGFEATRSLREGESSGHHTRIIPLTAHGLPGMREQCIAAGKQALHAMLQHWLRTPAG